jgi:hypothetical protein
MKTVGIAALMALLLGTYAHAAEVKNHQNRIPAAANACVDLRSALTHTEFGMARDTNCCDINGNCAQYLSTDQMLPAVKHRRT